MMRTKSVSLAAATAATGLFLALNPGGSALAAQPVAVSVKLANAGCETAPAWKAAGAGMTVTTSTTAHTGKKSCLLYASAAGAGSMSPSSPIVAKTVKGTTYTLTLWVSGNARGNVPVSVKLNEVAAGKTVTTKSVSVTAASATFKKVTVALVAAKDGSALNLTVSSSKLARKQGVRVDDLALSSLAAAPKPPATPTPPPTTTPTPPPTTPPAPPTTTPPPTTPPAPPTTTPPPTTPPAPPTTQPPAPVQDTSFGTTAQPRDGSLADAVARQDAKFGHLATLRYYAPGLPPAWSQITSLGMRDLVVSFKSSPATVLSGANDTYLTNWFASAPRDRQIWWTYFHEPENDVESGSFTPAQFKEAFKHVSELAHAAGRDDLRATMILMGYTANKNSGRNWQDYYPGGEYVDVMGWDSYNHAAAQGKGYSTPEAVFGNAAAVSKAAGKPMAIAETGAPLLPGDDGTGRAAYLRAAGAYLKAQGAQFVTYYDSTQGGAYTLDDAASVQAWKDLMH
jgi:hypothetical protein